MSQTPQNRPGPSAGSYGSPLTPEQHARLLSPIHPGRVTQTQGQSNLEAYDVRAHLTRLFGFGGWDGIADVMEMIGERWGENRSGKPAVTVAYRCRYTLRVRTTAGQDLATYTEWAMGDAQSFPEFKYGDAHDFAMKSAESQALKRCAMNLGDQFGLSLYRKGSLDAVVGWTMNLPASRAGEQSDRIDDQSVPDVTPESDPDTTVPNPEGQQDQGQAQDAPVQSRAPQVQNGPETGAQPQQAAPQQGQPVDWAALFEDARRTEHDLRAFHEYAMADGTCPPALVNRAMNGLSWFANKRQQQAAANGTAPAEQDTTQRLSAADLPQGQLDGMPQDEPVSAGAYSN